MSTMTTRILLAVGVLLSVSGVVKGQDDPVFTFTDEYYVNSLTTFHSIFGATTTGYGTAGIYQLTNTTTPTVTKLSNGSSVPGEFVQNTTPNANQELALFGWSASLNNGNPVASAGPPYSTGLYNLTNPLNGSVLYFRYTVGGSTTPFLFNSFDLRGASPSSNLSFTLHGYLGGSVVDTAVLTVTGNTLTTFTENWANVDNVEIDSTGSLPVNWGSGTLYMGNVVINSVPEPGPLIGAGVVTLIGLGYTWRKRRRAIA